MTENQFCYWLQGFFEMTDSTALSENQVKMISNHLKLVFKKETPTLEGLEYLQDQIKYKPQKLSKNPDSILPSVTC